MSVSAIAQLPNCSFPWSFLKSGDRCIALSTDKSIPRNLDSQSLFLSQKCLRRVSVIFPTKLFDLITDSVLRHWLNIWRSLLVRIQHTARKDCSKGTI